MLKSYRYRLFPTKSQVRILERQLELCRQVYNDALAYRKNAWEKEQRQVNRFETQNRLPQLKVEVQAGENPGYPRFKGKGRYDSITYPQSGFGLDSGKLHLSKIGDICSECGLSMDRDLNAAINILRLGMQSLRKSDRSPAL